MLYPSIPACYFPSTVLFIDKKHDFLLNFILLLDEDLAFKIVDSPSDGLDFIHKKRHKVTTLQKRCQKELQKASFYSLLHENNTQTLSAIHAEIYNADRFSEVSVVVVPYVMEEMNGLDFCRNLQNRDIKRILLIEKEDEDLAKKAEKEGLIHNYILENNPNITKLLRKNIANLQRDYFQRMSDTVFRVLNIEQPTCLKDKKFVHFFQELCKKKGVVEYYLSDHSGSFLMLDEDAKISFLLVKNKEELDCYARLASKNGIAQEIVDPLLNGEKIPCFWSDNYSFLEWNNGFFLPAKKVISDEIWFYAYVEGPVFFDVFYNEILSYHHYLENLDVEALLF